jgi:hypothetical protein
LPSEALELVEFCLSLSNLIGADFAVSTFLGLVLRLTMRFLVLVWRLLTRFLVLVLRLTVRFLVLGLRRTVRFLLTARVRGALVDL